MLAILASLFDHLKSQALTTKAYVTLTNQLNMSFKKVFERPSEVQATDRLASEAGSFDARGGEGPSRKDHTFQWKPALEFGLRDESDDDDIQVLSMDTPSKVDEVEDDEEVEYITNVVVGI